MCAGKGFVTAAKYTTPLATGKFVSNEVSAN